MATVVTTPICPCPNCGCTLNSLSLSVAPHSERIRLLLGTNEVPLDNEAAHVRHIHTSTKQDLQQLDSLIALLKTTIYAAIAAKKGKEHVLEEYGTILNPVRRVPNEVWREIFIRSVGDIFDESRLNDNFQTSSFDTTREPWNVSQVSKLWRAVSTSQPELWSSISVYPDTLPRQANNGLWKLFLLQHRRTGNHPLSIAYSTAQATLSVGSNAFLVHLLSSSRRWRKLFLAVKKELYIQFDQLADEFPLLEQAHISYKHILPNGTPAVNKGLITFLQSASMLSTLNAPHHFIRSSELPGSIRRWAPPDRNTGASVKSLFRVLAVCGSLRTCQYFLKGGSPSHANALTHHTLEVLELDGVSCAKDRRDLTMTCMDRLTLPSLRKLLIYEAEAHYGSLASFIDRSSCNITSLVLTDLPTLDHVGLCLQDVLQRTPALTELSIGYRREEFNIDELVDSLASLDAAGTLELVPNLSNIAFWSERDVPISCIQTLTAIRPNLTISSHPSPNNRDITLSALQIY